MTYKGKGVTVEKLLNDLADKYDWGWYIMSNPSINAKDGLVIIRKSKERGYEAGKEPKKSSRLDNPPPLEPVPTPTLAALRRAQLALAGHALRE
jgi:hypothetical protein